VEYMRIGNEVHLSSNARDLSQLRVPFKVVILLESEFEMKVY